MFLVVGIAAGFLFTPARRYLREPVALVQHRSRVRDLPTQLPLADPASFRLLGLLEEHSRSRHPRGTNRQFRARPVLDRDEPSHCPLWLAGLFYLFATQDGKRYRPIGWMFIIPFALFVIGRGRGYYMAPGYPMLLAAGAVWGERWVASLSSRRALVIRRTTWMALAIGALVDAAIVLPIAPPESLWWRFADKAHGGDFNEEIGWPELVQTIASIRDSYRSKSDPA